jgi:hypothetical protein
VIGIYFEWNGTMSFAIYVYHASISYRNELVFNATRTFGKISCSIRIFFPFFSNAYCPGANKGDLSHVTHCTIPLLSFVQISSISKALQYAIGI